MGVASASLRFGWLMPQLIVGYFAQHSPPRMPFYIIGAFGCAACLAILAAAIVSLYDTPLPVVTEVFLTLWVGYSFISGIVAVPYNDIVGRSIPSNRRSRMLSWRFFGGGILGVIVAGVSYRLLDTLPFPNGHSAILALAAILMLVSGVMFVSAGEPDTPLSSGRQKSFLLFLGDGLRVYRCTLKAEHSLSASRRK